MQVLNEICEFGRETTGGSGLCIYFCFFLPLEIKIRRRSCQKMECEAKLVHIGARTDGVLTHKGRAKIEHKHKGEKPVSVGPVWPLMEAK